MDVNANSIAEEPVERLSLLEELDKLEVVEAKELQEGISFFAFRFNIAKPQSR